MRRRVATVLSTLALLAPAAPALATQEPRPTDHLDVFSGVIDRADLEAITALGIDRRELVTSRVANRSKVKVEAILSGSQAEALEDQGVDLDPKLIEGQSVAARAFAMAEEEDDTVFHPYSGEGGIQEELIAQAAAHPDIAKLVNIGKTHNGQDITAVKVTRNARTSPDGAEPATVFLGAQHAREWITPEMVTRLLDHVLTGYPTDARIKKLVHKTEMWFIPVGNPDGYDFTFTEGQRLWRKNLRDNNGDGVITTGDGVDMNRNFAHKWGYDDEGSSPNPASETYRGPGPLSEPENQALDSLFADIEPEFLVNYHSAAELLLHGIGWQVATPSPDDVIYEAMVGTDANPAVPGYDPDLSAELYTTNGDTDSYLQEAYGTLGFTPEMATCESASAVDPDDEWNPADCGSGFEFPDDEELVQAEFEKNIPFALATAESALDPADPVSALGLEASNWRVDTFEVSYGDPQTVAVWARRGTRDMTLNYRINGKGERYEVPVSEWTGGERYGDENTDYYAEFRGVVEGAEAGDTVEVYFSGKGLGETKSPKFTYTVEQDSGNDVLVIANEDYTGVNPDYPDDVTAPKHLQAHLDALEANGVEADVWDVDAQGVPHDLGVLSHYDAVLWYLGDNRLTQDPEDAVTETYFGDLTDASVAERQQYLTLAIRDFLNEGGKLIHAGETAGYFGTIGEALGGIYYGLDGAPEQDCVVTGDPFADCLLLADDFFQYYLGAYARTPLSDVTAVQGTEGGPLDGLTANLGGPATVDNPVDEAGAFVPTSEVLDPGQFPWFGQSAAVADHLVEAFRPVEGEQAAAASHVDGSWQRLTRTFDLTGITAADQPAFAAAMTWNTEGGYDHVIVEARTTGGSDWTTLPDTGGNTSTEVPLECEAGFFIEQHPFLQSYLTGGDPCTPSGSTGSWNSLTGSSGGWQDLSFDLAAYAGQQVEISVSYVSDPATGGLGLLLDDTRLTTSGGASEAEGFESGFGAWSVTAPPTGSDDTGAAFGLSEGFSSPAGIATADTLLLGFGLEQIATAEERAAVTGAALQALGLLPALP